MRGADFFYISALSTYLAHTGTCYSAVMKRGKLISFVGGEGSGKTTCIKKLQAHHPVDEIIFTREPGGTELAEKVRDMFLNFELNLFEEFLAVQIARSIHFREKINPALQQGLHVVTDRCYESTWAYQIVAGGNHDTRLKKLFEETNNLACDGTEVDLFIDFHIDVEKSLLRKHGGDEAVNRFDTLPLQYHYAVRAGFDDFLSQPHIKHKVVKVNADDDEHTLASEVATILKNHL